MSKGAGLEETVVVGGERVPRRIIERSLVLATAGTCFGMFFFGLVAGDIFNRFLEHEGFKDEIAVFAAVVGLTGVFAVFGSWVLQQTGRRRTFFFAFTIPVRVMWVLVVFLPDIFPGKENEGILYYSLLAMSFVYWVANGLASNAYTSWMRDVVPERIRGRYFGYRTTVLTMVGAAWGLASGYLLESLGLGTGQGDFAFKVIYVVGVVFGVLDIATYLLVYHPPMKLRPREEATLGRMLKAALHRNFRRFIFVQSLWSFSAIMVGLSMYYLMRGIGMEIYAMQTARFVGIMVWVAFSMLWGVFLDRYGSKSSYLVGLVIHSLSPIFYALAPVYGVVFIYLGMAVGSIGASGVSLASMNLLYGLPKREDQAMSAAAFAMIAGLVGALANLLTGKVLYPLFKAHTPGWADPEMFYLMAVFSIAMMIRWGALMFSWTLPETEGGPRAWVVVRMFYTTNPIRAFYSLGKFLRAKSSDILSDGSYGRDHPSARWRVD